MSATLPPHGSVWRQRSTHRQMRVICADESEILAHDAEMFAVYHKDYAISSWRGTPEEFGTEFFPGDPEHYPQTAA